MNQTYQIKGMDCADCALKIEKGVSQLAGVDQVHLDFATGLMQVTGEAQPEDIQKRVSMLGYNLENRADRRTAQPPANVLSGFLRFMLARSETRLALVGGGLILLAVLLHLIGLLVNLYEYHFDRCPGSRRLPDRAQRGGEFVD